VTDALADARARLDEALGALRKAAHGAVDAAGDPRVDAVAFADARTRATYALAAVSLALKAAMRAAGTRPDD
jgi:hypothetical protein